MSRADDLPSRVFLVGFMGAGKTAAGRLLADEMSFAFVDLDDRIERRAGRSITTIFADSGESEFRSLERRELRWAAGRERVVVATGGGAFVSAENRDLIAGSGISVWLNPDFATVLRRVESQEEAERPLFTDPDRAAELFSSRREAYEQADLRIDVGPEEAPSEVAARVLKALREVPCAT